MTYYYVNAPVSGSITALDSYCDGSGPHTAVFGSSPLDIGLGGYGGAIRFYGSGIVRSVQAVNRPGQVCQGDAGVPWDDGVELQLNTLEDGNGSYIGSVFYSHVASPIANGVYNSPSGLTLGYIPMCRCNPCSPCACYAGYHSHMSASGSGLVRNGSLSCSGSVTAGSGGTWLYRFQL